MQLLYQYWTQIANKTILWTNEMMMIMMKFFAYYVCPLSQEESK